MDDNILFGGGNIMNKNLKMKLIWAISMATISGFVLAGCGTSKSTNSNNSKNAVQSTSQKSENISSSESQNKNSNESENKDAAESISGKSKNLSSTQVKANYSFSNFGIRLNKLVSDKVITTSQKSVILDLFNKKEITSSNFELQLNNLVAKKTITNSQKSTILHTFKSNQVQHTTVSKKKI